MRNEARAKEVETRCPECGNLLIDGRCRACDANQVQRQRRWRTGDRGGKRPERQPATRTFPESLDGRWRNSRHHIMLDIDIEAQTYESRHGPRLSTRHTFRLKEEKDHALFFYKDDLLIAAQISDMGFLLLHAADRKMAFAYENDGDLFRTCPLCYGKTPLEHNNCQHCQWEFEPFV